MKKLSNVSTRDAAVIALVRGLAFAIITFIYLFLPSQISSYLWALYIGFFLSMALGCKQWKKIIPILLSMACGFLWGYLYLHLSGWLELLLPALGSIVCTVVAEFVLTFSLLFFHLRFLSATPLCTIPAIFSAVAMIFASGTYSAVPSCAFSATVGMLMAFTTEWIIGRLLARS